MTTDTITVGTGLITRRTPMRERHDGLYSQLLNYQHDRLTRNINRNWNNTGTLLKQLETDPHETVTDIQTDQLSALSPASRVQ